MTCELLYRNFFNLCFFICCLISEGSNHLLQTLHLTRCASGSGNELVLLQLLLEEDLVAAFLGFFLLCSFSLPIFGEGEAFLLFLVFAWLIFVSSSELLQLLLEEDLMAAFLGFFFLFSFSLLVFGEGGAFLLILVFAFSIFDSS